jgi:hypothetical protein
MICADEPDAIVEKLHELSFRGVLMIVYNHESALLCGVFMRLHLALFLAGGPFLPSLYVHIYNHEDAAEGKVV